MDPTTHEFLVGPTWKKKRQLILRRDGYICQWSKRYGRTVAGSIVHHIFPREEFPQYALCNWNLITVCADGHAALENNGALTDDGIRLLIKTARKNNIPIPERYASGMTPAR